MTKQDAKLSERKKESFRIFDDIAPTYDSLNRTLSFGIDVYWRHQIKNNLPQKPNIHVLDLATGTADVPLVLAKAKQVERIQGLDLSEKMVEIGKVKVEKAGLNHRIQLGIGDGCNLPVESESYDATTVSFGIRNFPSTLKGLQEMHRILKPGGRAMVMEFSLPTNFLVKFIYLFYFRHVLPFVGNLFSGHGDAYSYLNKTVEDYPYGEDFLNIMREAGFKTPKAHPLTFGIATLYIGDKEENP
ncbi:MAG: bifunctional demethylmenaquinone methyltransferase/2-methoxy-6-polyprenyl-1,4-benzoquinol methylase UbiE [Halobacteriovoraceae bacterium]|nr:bifunctional demethylmenaquinone methyltransferase/2-methoxy-6-polyprenyl-1,4-benzoquinol methylase UbiE [Halobacteriovoraceae bacterium]MBC97621.1 bifunctional demethylmenaquinone methyltransferase/2-methoxy-6-polyprenyl-1,4-benzoquinol methylase UbiE [Halobacteriovoraceae bacterium]|tara:strand:+ start:30881 stop:31612 length:732 start_codon:yes stop_codon:yes gene_type:complete